MQRQWNPKGVARFRSRGKVYGGQGRDEKPEQAVDLLHAAEKDFVSYK
jgi:hypothetical protein